MSEKPLKIVPAPEAKTAPAADTAAAEQRANPRAGRKRLRMVLLVVIPLIVAVAGATFYLLGGRYISTDNAYVGAQKVLITPEISGKVIHVAVREGQHVNPGDELFTLDAEPYRLALQQAQAKLDTARVDYDKLKTDLASLTTLADLAAKNVAYKQRDLERKLSLVKSQTGSQADVDTAGAALVTAQLQAQSTKQQRESTLNQLLNDPELPLARFPEYAQAKAALDDAQRNLDHTVLRAPISGTATQVDNIQLGRFVAAGTPVFSVIDDKDIWVDANPKETDITYLRVGQTGDARRRQFPRPHLQGSRGRGLARHRRAVLHPAAAERDRKLGQGGAARSRAHRLRQRRGHAPVARRHERGRRHRHRP